MPVPSNCWREKGPATQVAGALRKAGVSADLVLEIRKLKANFKHAARVQATYVVMVAPSEWGEGKVRKSVFFFSLIAVIFLLFPSCVRFKSFMV